MKNLVLIDFTDESLHALEYAVEFSKAIHGQLEMVNVTDGESFDDSYDKLDDLRNRFSDGGFSPVIKSVVGSFDSDLPEYIQSQKIGFVFCGTHDLRFTEYFFSSRALKMMNQIHANFLFIPKTLKTFRQLKHVMAPILLDKHSLQKLEALRYLSMTMKFKLTLVTFKSDSKSEMHELNERLYMARRILAEANIEFSIDYVGRSESEMKSMILDHAVASKVDLVSLVNLTQSNFINMGAKVFMDTIIRNEHKIPILATQDKQLASVTGYSVSGGV